MMKVTKTTLGMMMKNRADSNRQTVMVQRMRKDGTWGKPLESQRFGAETDEQVVERLINNNGVMFRLAR